MRKPRKVVPIEEKKASLIARDTKAHRLIFAIGSERMAVDFFSRITRLPPNTGDTPATLLPMNQKNINKSQERTAREGKIGEGRR